MSVARKRKAIGATTEERSVRQRNEHQQRPRAESIEEEKDVTRPLVAVLPLLITFLIPVHALFLRRVCRAWRAGIALSRVRDLMWGAAKQTVAAMCAQAADDQLRPTDDVPREASALAQAIAQAERISDAMLQQATARNLILTGGAALQTLIGERWRDTDLDWVWIGKRPTAPIEIASASSSSSSSSSAEPAPDASKCSAAETLILSDLLVPILTHAQPWAHVTDFYEKIFDVDEPPLHVAKKGTIMCERTPQAHGAQSTIWWAEPWMRADGSNSLRRCEIATLSSSESYALDTGRPCYVLHVPSSPFTADIKMDVFLLNDGARDASAAQESWTRSMIDGFDLDVVQNWIGAGGFHVQDPLAVFSRVARFSLPIICITHQSGAEILATGRARAGVRVENAIVIGRERTGTFADDGKSYEGLGEATGMTDSIRATLQSRFTSTTLRLRRYALRGFTFPQVRFRTTCIFYADEDLGARDVAFAPQWSIPRVQRLLFLRDGSRADPQRTVYRSTNTAFEAPKKCAEASQEDEHTVCFADSLMPLACREAMRKRDHPRTRSACTAEPSK